jgi:hypothetical protein
VARAVTSSREHRPGDATRGEGLPPHRADLAVRHAGIEVCRGITYPIGIGRWERDEEYSRRETELLSYYCALHRSSDVGYLGTACDQEALAEVVAAFLRHPFSRDTLDRAHADLVSRGLLLRSYTYTATGRRIGADSWTRNRTVVYTLTREARNVWSRPTSEHPSATCGSYDLPFGESEPSCEELRTRDRPSSARRDEADGTFIEVSRRSPRPVAHRAPPVGALREPRTGPRPSGHLEPRQSARPVAPLATLADGGRMEGDSHPPCQHPPPASRGVVLRPCGAEPIARRQAAQLVLETLRACTYASGRLEELVCRQARAEIDPNYDGQRSGVPWDYWLAQWPTLSRRERKRWARTELIPLLAPSRGASSRRRPAAQGAPTPAATSPPRASPAPPPGPEPDTPGRSPVCRLSPAELAALPPYLRDALSRYGGEEDGS